MQCRVGGGECVLHHPYDCLPGIPGVGLVAQTLGLVQEGEPVGHRSQGGSRFTCGLDGGSEVGDHPSGVGRLVLVGGTEEDLVAQVGDQLSEFGDLASDGDGDGDGIG